MTQYGFFIDQSRCIGCNQCTIACMQWHDIPPGPVKLMRVYQWEKGNFPEIGLKALPVNCYHCENPVCVKACPSGALFKEKKYGAVLVDADKCEGGDEHVEQPVMIRTRFTENREGQPVDVRDQFTAARRFNPTIDASEVAEILYLVFIDTFETYVATGGTRSYLSLLDRLHRRVEIMFLEWEPD